MVTATPGRPARVVLLLLSLAVVAATGHRAGAQPAAPPAAPSLPPLVQAVAGIISFTRWPSPHDTVSLCLLDPADGPDPFFAAPIQAGGMPVRPRRVSLSGGFEECDAVYVGPLSLPERQALLQRLQNLPVLTLGDATPGCTDMTMFCLRTAGGAVTFSTNIDIIARSGVRLSPRVLQLGRRPGVP